MGKKYLTLNIGANTVSLAEFEASGRSLVLVNYGLANLSAPLDSGSAETILSPALLEIVREKGIKPGPVAVSISGQLVFPRFAAIPFAGGAEKFEQMIRYEIEQNVPFPIDEMVCDHQVLGETESGDKSVMIVAAKIDQVESITSAIIAAGFSPTIVDAAPIALINAVKATTPGNDSSMIVLDIGAKTTSLAIVEGDKLYNRSIPIAGNNITREISQALGCSTEEAEQIKREKGYVAMGGAVEDEDGVADRVAKVCRAVLTRLQAEISRSINFYRSQQGGSAPVKLYLSGGSALLPQIDQFFAEGLQIEVDYFNPLSIVGIGASLNSNAINSDGAMLASAVGMALQESGTAHYSVNLLPPSIKSARAEKAKIPTLVIAGVLLVVASATYMVAGQKAASDVAAVADEVDQKVNMVKGVERKLKTAQGEVETALTAAESMKTLALSRSTMIVRLNAVRAALANGMWIEKWEDGKVTIRGWKDSLLTAVKNDAVQNGGKQRTASEIVVAKLKGNAIIDPESIKISDMSTIGKSGEVEQFTVELKFK